MVIHTHNSYTTHSNIIHTHNSYTTHTCAHTFMQRTIMHTHHTHTHTHKICTQHAHPTKTPHPHTDLLLPPFPSSHTQSPQAHIKLSTHIPPKGWLHPTYAERGVTTCTACGPQPHQLHKHFYTAHPHNRVYTHTTDHSALQPKVYRGDICQLAGYHPEKIQPVVHKCMVIWCLHATIQRRLGQLFTSAW